MKKSFPRTVVFLVLAAGKYENVNGFAALKLEEDGTAKLTVYGEEFPCVGYTATTKAVTLRCVPVPIEFKRRGNQLANDMPFNSYRLPRRFPFRGPTGTTFGEFHRTTGLN